MATSLYTQNMVTSFEFLNSNPVESPILEAVSPERGPWRRGTRGVCRRKFQKSRKRRNNIGFGVVGM